MNDRTLVPLLRFVQAERGWPLSSKWERIARCLPAVACAGFEFSLTGDHGIDLQQRIRSGTELRRLKECLRRYALQGWMPADSPWSKLAHFCDSDLLGGAIEELWLELDDAAFDELPPLSVFVRLSEASANDAQIIEVVLRAFDVSISSRCQQALANCLDACRGKARISHVGLMLSRPSAPLRLIVEDIASDDMLPFLERAGWSGTHKLLQERLDVLFTHIDRIRLALTVSDTVESSLGLECFLGNPNKSEPRWKSVCDWLVGQELCNEEQRAHLLSWPTLLLPSTVKGMWPEQLIVDALTRDPAMVDWLECRISHLKITHHEQRPLSAKAYVGVIQILDDTRAAASASTPNVRNELEQQEAIDAAVDFLLAARNQAGWWQDYEGFREGISDEWVTAYIAHAMDESGIDRMETAVKRAWFLLTKRSRVGWGWNYLQPADADSTLWTLRLASRLGKMNSPCAEEGLAFLRQHLQSTGISTYIPDHYRLWSKEASINPGWYEPHMCVTAVAASFAPLGQTPLSALRANQCSDGSWQGYWWKSPVYTTVHAAEALHRYGAANDQERFEAAATWMCNRIDETTRPFEQALMLRLLSLQPNTYRAPIEVLKGTLLASQNHDGSWPGSAELAIPNAAGEEVVAWDKRRLFTTATVVSSLCQLSV
ncbi:MAG: prenyltransferase/squalene oxidase repeat-containing protein [Pseudomonadota bacterium]